MSFSLRRPVRTPHILAPCLLAGLSLMASAPAAAQDFKLGSLTIEQPWARPTIAKTGAAYFTVRNDGASDDALLSIESDVSIRVEVHEMKMDGAVMRMRAVEQLSVPAGRSVALAPGGYHVMLIGLKAPLKEGETFPMKLVFEKAGTAEVTVKVATPEEMRKGQSMPDTKPGMNSGGSGGQMPGMDMH